MSPCPNEEAALSRVLSRGLGRMPHGCRPAVAGNGSAGVASGVAAEYGAAVVSEPRRGFGAAFHVAAQAPGSRFAEALAAIGATSATVDSG